MKHTSNLLIVANTPSPNTQRLADAVCAGAAEGAEDGNPAIIFKTPLAATADDVLAANGVIIGTTENFGYMSGQIKDFFERVYYPCLEKTEALPWALYIRAGRDGTGTNRAVHAIVGGMRWREVQEPLLLVGAHQESFIQSCHELGMALAAGINLNIFR